MTESRNLSEHDKPSADGVELDSLPYRPCVGIMLFNQDGLVFVAQRLDTTVEAWQMPQGGIDPGENPREAAFRELKEEIGTNNAEIVGESRTWLRYDLPSHLVGKVWKGRFRGQEQKWFAMRFLGEDAEIDIGTEHPEFTAWRWTPIDMLPEIIVPFKRQLYENLVDEFRELREIL